MKNLKNYTNILFLLCLTFLNTFGQKQRDITDYANEFISEIPNYKTFSEGGGFRELTPKPNTLGCALVNLELESRKMLKFMADNPDRYRLVEVGAEEMARQAALENPTVYKKKKIGPETVKALENFSISIYSFKYNILPGSYDAPTSSGYTNYEYLVGAEEFVSGRRNPDMNYLFWNYIVEKLFQEEKNSTASVMVYVYKIRKYDHTHLNENIPLALPIFAAKQAGAAAYAYKYVWANNALWGEKSTSTNTTAEVKSLSPKKELIVKSSSEAEIYSSLPLSVTIGDIENYDHDSISVLVKGPTSFGVPDRFEITLLNWKKFEVKPGDVLLITALSEGLLPPCTIGVRLSSGKSFQLFAKKGETMKIEIKQPDE